MLGGWQEEDFSSRQHQTDNEDCRQWEYNNNNNNDNANNNNKGNLYSAHLPHGVEAQGTLQ